MGKKKRTFVKYKEIWKKWATLVAQEMQVPSLGQEDYLEKEMATHSSNPTWEIQWTKEGSQKSWTWLSD